MEGTNTGTFSDGGGPYGFLRVSLYERQLKRRRLFKESFKVTFHFSHCKGEFQILQRHKNIMEVCSQCNM